MNHEDTKTRSLFKGNQGENSVIPDELEKVATLVVDSAFAVHKNLEVGLLEGVYETCFCHELQKRGVKFERQVILPIICELKAVDEISPIHQAQMLTHLKLAHKRLGFLINFNVPLIKHGIKRMVL